MPENPDERMIAYLLDELPEAERVRIEGEYLAGGQAMELMLAAEIQLYDDYSREVLSAGRRRRFEEKFLATPEQQRRLQIARALHKRPGPPKSGRVFFLRQPRAAAIAAAVLLTALAVWFQAGRPPVREPGPDPAPPRTPVVAAFTLVSGVTRGQGAEQTFDIPAAAGIVRLTAQVETPAGEYQAILTTPEGNEIWRGGAIKGESRHVVVEIPAELFSSGHYLLAIQNPEGMDLADYAFRARK